MSHGPICELCGRMGEQRVMTEDGYKVLLDVMVTGDSCDIKKPGELYTMWGPRDQAYESWPEHMRTKGVVCVHCRGVCVHQPFLTCDGCEEADCPGRGDGYNTSGECIMEK